MGVEAEWVGSFGETPDAIEFNNYTLDRAAERAEQAIAVAEQEIAQFTSMRGLRSIARQRLPHPSDQE